MGTESYDVIVIGAGPTGENIAERTAKGGLRTAIVENELIGGECSYWACVPSKAMLRPLEALGAARSVAGAREAVSGGPDAQSVLKRRDSFVGDWKDDRQVEWLRRAKIDLHRGRGRLAGERLVTVTAADGSATDLAAVHAVALCVGSKAAIPAIPGMDDAHPWTSRDATAARKAPRRLAILGGGVVGCEMATAWKQLGAEEVTVVERGSRLLSGYEAFAGEAVRASLEEAGVRVLTGVRAHKVERAGGEPNGRVRLFLDGGVEVESDELLVAAGRAPRTEDLGLEHVGLRSGSWLDVDESMRVRAVPSGWLYAAGDVSGRALLTHMGKYEARIAGDAIVARATTRGSLPEEGPWSRFAATATQAAVPQVVFTNPQVAAVGVTEEQARAAGIRARAVEYEIQHVTGAPLYADGYRGRAKMVVDEDRKVVIGVTFVGPSVGELIHAATIAIVGAVPLHRLWHAVPSFPTISEVWLRLLEAYGL